MAGTPSHWDWPRLADRVVSRRVALGMTRGDLSAATGVHERSIGKLERGESVSRDTVAKAEIALRWVQGSGRSILEGGEAAEADREPDRPADPSYRAILDAEGLTEGEKLEAIAAIEARRARLAAAGFSERHQHALLNAGRAAEILMDRKRQADDEANGKSGDRSA